MQLTFHHDDAEFTRLAGEWNALLSRSASDVPFLRYEYVRAWWSTRGGGEWEQAELWLGVGRDSAGALQGIAPLFRARTPAGSDGLMILGSIEISDYLDLIVPPGSAMEFADDLLRAVGDSAASGPKALDLYNIPEASPTLGALEAAAAVRRWAVTRERLQPCPVIALPGSWDDYLSRLEKKQRHELRRKLRRAGAHPTPARLRLVGPGEDLEAATESLLRLMAYEVRKTGFLTESMRRQFRATVQAAAENGWLQLAFLDVGGVSAAGYLNFDYGGRIWVYNSGISPEHTALSPGTVLLAHLIRWAIENGRSEFDFLRGDEPYKRHLGGVDRVIHRLTLVAPEG
jgi:CelD/BcsL family acetyltransferase involved in cellulose biosynthesis